MRRADDLFPSNEISGLCAVKHVANRKRVLAGLAGFEPTTRGLENRCSILMSYRPLSQIPLGMVEVRGVEPLSETAPI